MPETIAPANNATPPVEGNQPEAPAIENTPKVGEKVYEIKYPDGRTEKRGESWLLERAQKSVGLEKRVSEADRYEKAFNTFVGKVQDPQQLLELLNHPDLKYDEEKQESLVKSMLNSKKPRIIEAVKKWLWENEVEPGLLKEQDPKEYEKRMWQQKAEKLESDKLKEEKARKEEEEERSVAQIKESYRVQLGEAYKTSGLPIDDFMVRQVMEKARLYVRAGKQPDFKHCCELVQKDFLEQTKAILGKATVENILNYLDGETAKTINKALMKAVEKKEESPNLEGQSPKPRKKEKEMSYTERKKWLRNLERGIVD